MTQPYFFDHQPAPRRSAWSGLILTQLVVILAVLASGIVGAGVLRGRDGGTDVVSLFQAASTTAESAKTFRATTDMAIDVTGHHVEVTGDVLSDVTTHEQKGSIEVPGAGRMQVVQVGSRAFFQLPKGRADAQGHHWLSVVMSRGAGQTAIGGQDPTAYFKLLADPADVKTVGTETVSGTKATHYRVKPDPQRLVTLGAQALGTALPPGAADSVKNLHMDVWIDGDNRVRRMRMQLKEAQVSMLMTINVLDLDQPVHVVAPPVSDVTTLPNLAALSPALLGALSG